MRMNRILLLSLFAFLGVIALEGCRKKGDTIAIIHVRDASNQAVSGARVVLYGQSTTNQPSNVVLYDTTSTNSAGEATFNFNDVYQLGQAGVAILNIDVLKNSQTGTGIIKVEEETTTEETVYIQ